MLFMFKRMKIEWMERVAKSACVHISSFSHSTSRLMIVGKLPSPARQILPRAPCDSAPSSIINFYVLSADVSFPSPRRRKAAIKRKYLRNPSWKTLVFIFFLPASAELMKHFPQFWPKIKISYILFCRFRFLTWKSIDETVQSILERVDWWNHHSSTV